MLRQVFLLRTVPRDVQDTRALWTQGWERRQASQRSSCVALPWASSQRWGWMRRGRAPVCCGWAQGGGGTVSRARSPPALVSAAVSRVGRGDRRYPSPLSSLSFLLSPGKPRILVFLPTNGWCPLWPFFPQMKMHRHGPFIHCPVCLLGLDW